MTGWAVFAVYLLGVVVCWYPLAARVAYVDKFGPGNPDGADWLWGGFIGLGVAVFWPLGAAIFVSFMLSKWVNTRSFALPTWVVCDCPDRSGDWRCLRRVGHGGDHANGDVHWSSQYHDVDGIA